MLKVKQIPKNERPYERLIQYGKELLSTEELLAILIKSGYKNNNSKMLAGEVLSQIGSIGNLKSIKYEDLIHIKGIGQAKACNILAAIELGKRMNHTQVQKEEYQIRSAEDVYYYIKDYFDDKEQEYFYCLYLDTKKRIKRTKLLFIGTINYSIVHPREIFKEAYLSGANSIIMIHNHPTGDVSPSKQDIETTGKMLEIGQVLGIQMDDHVIIGYNNYYSFFENNQLG